jgi:hypothetical protein
MIITLLSDPRDSSVARRKGRICIHSTSPNPIIKFLKPSDKHRCNSMCKRNSGFSRYCPLRAFVAFVSTSTDPHPFSPDASCANDLLELLLGAELVGVTALLLALWRLLVHHVEMWQGCRSSCKNDGAVAGTYAVDSPRGQAGVALAADHLVAVVLGGKGLKGRLDDTTTQTEDQVESRLLLDVVIGKSAAVLELLAGEDQALLVRGNALLVLDLGLDIVCPRLVACSFCVLRCHRSPNDASKIACALLCGGVALSGNVRTDGVGGLDLKGDGLARHCERVNTRQTMPLWRSGPLTGLHEDL